ncbi:MAG: hypothetical protein PF447_01135 [Spirochaetaceae bacterium]|jgi:hypothetical protein|nr:hypothetical protein [Spirochaetaceae bacterium]
MKKIMIILSMLLSLFFQLSAQSGPQEEILFLYEESNEQLEPWLSRIRSNLFDRGIDFKERAASDIEPADLEEHRRILIYGAVMAFSTMEPLRDWLRTDPDLSGKDVVLLVTANRWFLEKYQGQLMDLLEKNNANLIDGVSGATQEMSNLEKDQMVDKALGAIQNP